MNITEMQAVVSRMSMRDYPVEGAHLVLGVESDREGWILIMGKSSTGSVSWSTSMPSPNNEKSLIRTIVAVVGLQALMAVEARFHIDGQRACDDIQLAVPFGLMFSLLP